MFATTFLAEPVLDSNQSFCPSFAGVHYTNDFKSLTGQIETLLEQARVSNDNSRPRVLIIPAGSYMYVGGQIGDAYKQIIGENYSGVLLIGPAVNCQFDGANVFPGRFLRTPLGSIDVDANIVRRLLAEGRRFTQLSAIGFDNNYFIEAQLPFLKYVIKNEQVTPIVIGNTDKHDLGEIVQILANAAHDENLLIVFSTNPITPNSSISVEEYRQALLFAILRGEVDRIVDINLGQINRNNMIIALAVETAAEIGCDVSEIFRISTEYKLTDGAKSDHVYVSAAFYDDYESDFVDNPKLSEVELEKLSNYAINHMMKLTGKKTQDLSLNIGIKNLGVMIRIKKDGRLIGSGAELLSHRDVVKVLESVVRLALWKDPISGYIDADLLNDSQVDFIFTGRAKQIIDPATIPDDGLLYLRRDGHSSIDFIGYHHDRYKMLESICINSGLEFDCWRSKETEIYYFSTQTKTVKISDLK